MKTIHVTASREYDVVIGAGLLDECGQRIAAAVPGAEKAVVYTDTTVFPLYAKRVTESLDRKSTRLNSSHWNKSRMPSSA